MSESLLHSVVVTVDGPSKAGTTAIIERIGDAAGHQETMFSILLDQNAVVVDAGADGYDEEILSELQSRHQMATFEGVTVIRGGNFYRAAALYVMLSDLKGEPKTSLDETDADAVREILALDGIQEVLDNDPNLGRGVSDVFARYAGAQALCSTMLTDAVLNAYGEDGMGGLVIVDARDPLGHMERNSILGALPGRIDPNSIVPLYVQTPADIAGSRMPGDLDENIKLVEARRLKDATREENPVHEPTSVVKDLGGWRGELLAASPFDTGEPFLVVNDRRISLEDLDALGAIVVAAAQKLGEQLYGRKALFGLVSRRPQQRIYDNRRDPSEADLVHVPDFREPARQWP